MNIIIHIGKVPWLLRGEPKNFELCRTVNRRDKSSGRMKREWIAEKWFATPEGVFQTLLNMKLLASDAKSLKEMKARIENIRKELMEFYNTALPT